MHAVHRYSLWPIATDVAWSVCLSVCWSQPCAVLKQLNQLRCRLWCGLWWAQGTMYYVAGQDLPGKGALFLEGAPPGHCEV